MRHNDRVNIHRDDGIVLRTQQLADADQLVTLLTLQAGRVRAVAKGARRTKSRFRNQLEPFSHLDVRMYSARSMDVITQTDVVRPYAKELAPGFARSAAAMAEAAEKFTPVLRAPATDQFLLLVGGLRALADQERDPGLVLDAYLLRSLAVAGSGLPLEDCDGCSADCCYPHPRMLCRCSPAAAPQLAMPAEQTVDLMRALMQGDWETADASDPRHRAECSEQIRGHLEWNLEHSISSPIG
jgi:DNA repair protein RecO (recombination protein O)